jgi:hypothetical protein
MIRWSNTGLISFLPFREVNTIRLRNANQLLLLRRPSFLCSRTAVLILIALAAATAGHAVEPTPAAIAGFNSYIATLESRLGRQHQSQDGFIASVLSDPDNRAKLQRGEPIVERIRKSGGPDLPGATLYHWRGTAFVPGATVADYERVMEDFDGMPKTFAPEIVRAKLLSKKNEGGRTFIQAWYRVKQHHVITVVMDIAYDVVLARLDAQHGYSASRSTRITEIADAGAPDEHAMSSNEGHGFMWRLNAYWSYEERDGGLYMQIESVSLARSIPTGLAWAVKPFVESVPRESLEFTMQATTKALRK